MGQQKPMTLPMALNRPLVPQPPVCTGEVRYVVRNGLSILQQKWLLPAYLLNDGTVESPEQTEWRDVPTVHP